MIAVSFTPGEALAAMSGLSMFIKASETGGDTVAEAAFQKVMHGLADWRVSDPAGAAMLDAEFEMRKRFDRGEIG